MHFCMEFLALSFGMAGSEFTLRVVHLAGGRLALRVVGSCCSWWVRVAGGGFALRVVSSRCRW